MCAKQNLEDKKCTCNFVKVFWLDVRCSAKIKIGQLVGFFRCVKVGVRHWKVKQNSWRNHGPKVAVQDVKRGCRVQGSGQDQPVVLVPSKKYVDIMIVVSCFKSYFNFILKTALWRTLLDS